MYLPPSPCVIPLFCVDLGAEVWRGFKEDDIFECFAVVDDFFFALTSKIVSLATVLMLEYSTKSNPVGIPDTLVAVDSAKYIPDQIPRPYLSTKVNAANEVAANNDSATGVENKTLIGDTANNNEDL